MYRPPEMIDKYLKEDVDEKADIWMLGCVLFILETVLTKCLIFLVIFSIVGTIDRNIVNPTIFFINPVDFRVALRTMVQYLAAHCLISV